MNGAKFQFAGVNSKRETQCLFLTQDEIDRAGHALFAQMSSGEREKLVEAALGSVLNARLLKLLAGDLKRRYPNAR